RSKRDWSSDVCSSDLFGRGGFEGRFAGRRLRGGRTDPDLLLADEVALQLRQPATVVRRQLSVRAQHLEQSRVPDEPDLVGDDERSEERRVGKGCEVRW